MRWKTTALVPALGGSSQMRAMLAKRRASVAATTEAAVKAVEVRNADYIALLGRVAPTSLTSLEGKMAARVKMIREREQIDAAAGVEGEVLA